MPDLTEPLPPTEPLPGPEPVVVPVATPEVPPTTGLEADGGPDGGPLPQGLHATAALVGEYRWIENALYRTLGGWVAEMPIPAVQVYLDGQSMRHAWHSDLWAERLPVVAGADPDALTVPSPPVAALFAALVGASPPTDVPGSSWPPAEDDAFSHPGALPRLAGLYRVVLPRLVASYQRHLQAATVVTDAPVIRALRLVLTDEIEDWQAGERMVQRLVARPHDVAAVYGFLQRLESVVVGAGASAGLAAFPDPVLAD